MPSVAKLALTGRSLFSPAHAPVPQLSVRKSALAAASRLVAHFPREPAVCELWARCALPLVRDPEATIQVGAAGERWCVGCSNVCVLSYGVMCCAVLCCKLAWRGVAWVAWRGAAWRGLTWRKGLVGVALL